MSGAKESNTKAVDGLTRDIMRATPEQIRAITNGKSDRLTSEQAHRIAGETARKADSQKEGG